ncbi:hypothetical protein H9X57_00360 [Flavobacterium piscinae]|uniref:Uncharacterized protein n=1 Tax=Flavobacterium piscinae TaxID=2506424 RepID=A0A4Q1KSX9_9FLAO|nr:DUF2268 domain-containing putative Zn-dependent protease [Flavobacterium piscinae]MBC8882432.1 hypothetical protein [Flavobacterium piscinae]RXR32499.1 hypothetical protein EQG68_06645 [Flavobacterium piscinae]
MKQIITTLFCFILTSSKLFSQSEISTVDIRNFWNAYNLLETARTKADSVLIFQTEYFNKATQANKKFIKLRKFTAEEVVNVIQRYPLYFSSIKDNSNKIDSQVEEINKYLSKLAEILPGFSPPKICFAFGCLRTGGTVSKNTILVGTEMITADSTSIFDELSPWLKSVVSKTGDITPLIIHEAVHTYQKNKYTKDLPSTIIKEGFAEFVTCNLLMLDNNPVLHSYGNKNECSLWKSFISDFKNGITDYSDWVYGGSTDENRPADLGYYIGLKIIEEYYLNSTDKSEALEYLSDCDNYGLIFKSSKYNGNCK